MPEISAGEAAPQASAATGVQSLGRAFELLEALADAGGSVRLSDLAASTRMPLPTIHRLVRTLVASGYVRQEVSRRYALGPRLIRLGDQASRTLGAWATPHLTELVDKIGETANLAIFDGDRAVYVAQIPSAHSMRMFTEIGRRVDVHSTGVGKALLSQLPDDEVRALVGRTGMKGRTEHTITTPDALVAELSRIRERGYAMDDGEYEIGVCCVAMPVPNAPTRAAMSISGPSSRVTVERMAEILPVFRDVLGRLSADLQAGNQGRGAIAVAGQ